jgi:hypothetical protein
MSSGMVPPPPAETRIAADTTVVGVKLPTALPVAFPDAASSVRRCA